MAVPSFFTATLKTAVEMNGVCVRIDRCIENLRRFCRPVMLHNDDSLYEASYAGRAFFSATKAGTFCFAPSTNSKAEEVSEALARHHFAADDVASGALVRPFGGLETPLPDAYWLVRPEVTRERAAVETLIDWLTGQALINNAFMSSPE